MSPRSPSPEAHAENQKISNSDRLKGKARCGQRVRPLSAREQGRGDDSRGRGGPNTKTINNNSIGEELEEEDEWRGGEAFRRGTRQRLPNDYWLACPDVMQDCGAGLVVLCTL